MGDHGGHMMDGSMVNMSTTTMMMDHGGHTTTMNHGGHTMGDGGSLGSHDGMMMMPMYFTTNWKETYVLFKQLQLQEWWHLLIACIVVGIVAALYEGLKVFREQLLISYAPQATNQYSTTSNGFGAGGESSKDDIVVSQPSNVSVRMCSGLHFLQTFLHIIQVTVSYLLMLVVMTFNVWLGLSVVLGAGLGYFIFGWKKAVIIDSNEHCH